jgi:hypothetical protein
MGNLLKTVAFLIAVCLPQVAFSQSSAEFGLEGHVFSSTSGKPLPNAIILLSQTAPNSGQSLVSQMFTDAGGLFSGQLGIIASDAGNINHINVICNTQRGSYSSSLLFYTPLQSRVYTRDVYLAVPKNLRCAAP